MAISLILNLTHSWFICTTGSPGVFAGNLSSLVGPAGKDGIPGVQGEPGLPVS
jgi:hypothetical protein